MIQKPVLSVRFALLFIIPYLWLILGKQKPVNFLTAEQEGQGG